MPLTLQKAAKPKAVTGTKKTAISLTVTKEKGAVSLTNQHGVLSGYESIVDQLAAIESVLTPEVLAALKKQVRLEAELRAVADKEAPADAKVVFTGTTHDFAVTEKGEQRKIADIQECRKKLGDKLFFELARINLSDVDKYLSNNEKNFVVTLRQGPRKGTLVKK